MVQLLSLAFQARRSESPEACDRCGMLIDWHSMPSQTIQGNASPFSPGEHSDLFDENSMSNSSVPTSSPWPTHSPNGTMSTPLPVFLSQRFNFNVERERPAPRYFHLTLPFTRTTVKANSTTWLSNTRSSEARKLPCTGFEGALVHLINLKRWSRG